MATRVLLLDAGSYFTQRIANVATGLLEAIPQLIDHLGRGRRAAVEPLARIEPGVSELFDERVEPLLRVHGAQVSLNIEVVDTGLPLIGPRFGQLPTQLVVLALKLLDSPLEIHNALVIAHLLFPSYIG